MGGACEKPEEVLDYVNDKRPGAPITRVQTDEQREIEKQRLADIESDPEPYERPVLYRMDKQEV